MSWPLLALLASCGSADDADDETSQELGGATTLPECPADYTPCDIQDADCQTRLIAIARCLRGGETAASTPIVIDFVSEEQVRQATLDEYAGMQVPNPNHFENALVLFGLTGMSSFQPEQSAERLATETAGLYRNSTKRIEIIQHAEPREDVVASALLLHEVVHALQDAEHDLPALWEGGGNDSVDSFFAVKCLVEGEARLHERRALAAMFGLDIAELDFTRSFGNAREFSEDWLFEQTDLYFASQGSMPYSHGSDYLYRLWTAEGQAAVRAQFAAPVLQMADVLSVLWGDGAPVEKVPFDAPVVPEGQDATVNEWTSMGAWALYLFLHARTDVTEARRLALAWRGDQLAAFALGTAETVARWQFELNTEADATRIGDLLRARGGSITFAVGGRRVTLAAGAAAPDWLLAP